jgi:hypothetical protein
MCNMGLIELIIALIFGISPCGSSAETAAVPAQLQASEREIYTALAYGDDVFEMEMWRVSAAEQELRTTATWESASLGAIAYLEYLHFNDGISYDELGEFFNEAWFEGSLANYGAWEQLASCEFDQTRLYQFSVTSNNMSYRMDYWVKPASETRVEALFTVFPADNRLMMIAYADRLHPELPTCEGVE